MAGGADARRESIVAVREHIEAACAAADFGGLLGECRQTWDRLGFEAAVTALSYATVMASQWALPGGELPDGDPQAVAIAVAPAWLEPLGARSQDTARAAQVVFLMASQEHPGLGKALRSANTEFKGSLVYLLVLLATSVLVRFEADMAGSAAVTLQGVYDEMMAGVE